MIQEFRIQDLLEDAPLFERTEKRKKIDVDLVAPPCRFSYGQMLMFLINRSVSRHGCLIFHLTHNDIA